MPGETDLRQRTRQFALRVIKLYSALPKSTEAQVLGKQLLRSGNHQLARLDKFCLLTSAF